MIKFTLSHFNGDNKSLEFPMEGMTELITPTLKESTSSYEVELSAEDAMAVTLISIRQLLTRISHQLDAASTRK